MVTNSSPYSASQFPEPIGVEDLSIAVISPSDGSRMEAMQAMSGCTGAYVSEFSSYSLGTGDLPSTLEEDQDVIIIDLDGDAEFALELVESICANGVATVMVYSENSDPELLVRCMRAGAREFLTLHFRRTWWPMRWCEPPRGDRRRGRQRRQRQATGVHGLEGWRRDDHAGLQFRRSDGQGVWGENPADRSRSAAGRCCIESWNRGGVFSHRRFAASGSAGREVPESSFW